MESDQAYNANSEGQPKVPGSTGQTPRVVSLVPQRPQRRSKKRSNLALASLVVGLGSLFVCLLSFLVSIPAIISPGMAIVGGCLGTTALRRIKRSGKRLCGVGLAIGGIVSSIVTLVLIVLIVLWTIQVVEAASTVLSLNDMHELNRAARSYADDHNGELPDPAGWKEELESYLGGNAEDVLKWAFRPGTGRGIAMNQSLVNSPWGKSYDLLVRNTADPSRTVMFFESKLGQPAGGPELLPEEPAGRQGYVIGFVNGYVETIPKDQLDRLIWTPQSK